VQPEDLRTRETPPTPQIRTIADTKTATNPPHQYHIDISTGFVMHKGIPIAIVRVRQKTVRQYVLVVLEY